MSGTTSNGETRIEIKNYPDIENETHINIVNANAITERDRRKRLLIISITTLLINLGFSIAVFVDIHNESYEREWKTLLIFVLIFRIVLLLMLISQIYARIDDDALRGFIYGMAIIYILFSTIRVIDYWFYNIKNYNKIIHIEIIIETGILIISYACLAIAIVCVILFFLVWLFRHMRD